MANPFSLFRRNQRAMLAIFGVLLMIAFVLSGSMSSWSNTSRTTSQNPAVVRTDYGTLHEQELLSMTMMRSVVGSFLQQLVRLRIDGMATKGEVRTDQEKALYERFFTERLINPVLARYHQQQPEYAAVETMILARRADELGVVVSENSVNEFIRFVTDNQVSAGDIQETISHINLGGGPISQRRLFDALRTELKASRLQQMFQVSLGPLPPGERWDYYTRLKRQVNTEIMPVPVKNFVEQVPDPTDDELRKFFEKYKYQVAIAGSPYPGFKKPPRGQFQYFKAAYNNFVDQAEVTDKEIEEYYNTHKDPTFRKSELPADPDTGAKQPDAGSDGSADPATSDPSTKDAPANADAPSDTPQPDSSEDTPAEQDAKSTEPKTDAAPNAEKDKPDKQSSVNRQVIRFAAASNEQLLAQAGKKAPAAKAPASSAANKTSPAASAPAQPADTAESKADEASTDETKPADANADEAKASDTKSADQPAADESASEDKPANTDKSADKDDEFEPLEKVRDQIRRELANRWIQRKIDGIFDELTGEMRQYADQRILDSTKEIPPFDFEGAAKRFGLDAFETGMLSPQQLFSTDLGKASILDEIGRPRYRVAQRAFSKNAQDLQPETSVDLENNRYLYWRIKHEEEEVPAFEDVRKQVLQAWKMKEARKLAREQAEKLADEARSKDQTLAGTFGAEKVRETGKFSWLTFGNAANVDAPQMSDVPGVEMPGHEFMQTVHHLELGEIAVALNQPETVAYVVRVTDVDLPSSAFDDFATTDPKLYAAVAGSEQQRTFQDWMRNLEESVNLHWEREPKTTQAF